MLFIVYIKLLWGKNSGDKIMDEIKKLFKRMFLTSLIFLIAGLLTKSTHILVGLLSGSIISILSLYILSMDVKSIAYCKDHKLARKIAILGYLKRYVLYLIYLGLILHFLDFKYFLSAIIGLLSVRLNIYLILLEEKLKKFKK